MGQKAEYIPGSLLAAFQVDAGLPAVGSHSQPATQVNPPDKHRPDERRATYRCPVTGARRAGRLRIGPGDVAVEILDESAGGFSAASNEPVDCQVGEILFLEIASDWVEVRVVHLQPRESGTRLGLARLRDVDQAEIDAVPARLVSWASLRDLMRALSPLGRPLASAVGLAVGGLVVSGLVIGVLEYSAPAVAVVRDDEAGENHKKIEEFRPLSVPPAQEKRPVAPKPVEAPREARPEKLMPEEVIRRSQPEVLLQPEVAKLLALTREQLDELQRIFDESRSAASAVLAGAAAQLSAAEREVQIGKLVLAVLTDQQRNDLTRILSATDSPPAAETADEPPRRQDGR